jgi:hypothetical protein
MATNDRQAKNGLIFIFGCQRSGTTLLSRIFDRDPTSLVYNERSALTSDDSPRGLRLNPLPDVARQLNATPVGLTVLKPLVESHRSSDLLDYFEGSKAIWLYRNYWSVAKSIVERWGPDHPIQQLQPIVEERPGDWRSEGLSLLSRENIRSRFSVELDPLDTSALFWYARNRLFFDQNLVQDERVYLCRYEELVGDPWVEMNRIYRFLGLPSPDPRIVKGVHVSSLGALKAVGFSPSIRELCQGLLDDLNREKRSNNERHGNSLT